MVNPGNCAARAGEHHSARGFFPLQSRVPSHLPLSEASGVELGIDSWINESRIEPRNPVETTFFYKMMWLSGEIDPQLVNLPTRDFLAD